MSSSTTVPERPLAWDPDTVGIGAYTGQDLTAYAFIPIRYITEQRGSRIVQTPVYKHYKLGTLSFISWATMRTKSMVTSLGRGQGVGFTRGMRVITGVMSFLQSDRNPFHVLFDTELNKDSLLFKNMVNPDELPPFDLFLVYAGEDRDVSVQTITHVEIVQSQGTTSVDDLNPQETYSFVALGISPLTPLTKLRSRPKDSNIPRTITFGPINSGGPTVTDINSFGIELYGYDENGNPVNFQSSFLRKPGKFEASIYQSSDDYLRDANALISPENLSVDSEGGSNWRMMGPVIDSNFISNPINGPGLNDGDNRWDAIRRTNIDAFPIAPPDTDEDAVIV